MAMKTKKQQTLHQGIFIIKGLLLLLISQTTKQFIRSKDARPDFKGNIFKISSDGSQSYQYGYTCLIYSQGGTYTAEFYKFGQLTQALTFELTQYLNQNLTIHKGISDPVQCESRIKFLIEKKESDSSSNPDIPFFYEQDKTINQQTKNSKNQQKSQNLQKVQFYQNQQILKSHKSHNSDQAKMATINHFSQFTLQSKQCGFSYKLEMTSISYQEISWAIYSIFILSIICYCVILFRRSYKYSKVTKRIQILACLTNFYFSLLMLSQYGVLYPNDWDNVLVMGLETFFALILLIIKFWDEKMNNYPTKIKILYTCYVLLLMVGTFLSVYFQIWYFFYVIPLFMILFQIAQAFFWKKRNFSIEFTLLVVLGKEVWIAILFAFNNNSHPFPQDQIAIFSIAGVELLMFVYNILQTFVKPNLFFSSKYKIDYTQFTKNVSLNRIFGSEGGVNIDTCPVCNESLDRDPETRQEIFKVNESACGHLYHGQCLKKAANYYQCCLICSQMVLARED